VGLYILIEATKRLGFVSWVMQMVERTNMSYIPPQSRALNQGPWKKLGGAECSVGMFFLLRVGLSEVATK